MRIGMVGCGFVADMYLGLLANHPTLELGGITDLDGERARRMAAAHGTKDYGSLRALLDDEDVRIVVNLTNPRNHYEVSRPALEAGKHVYSEKPLATDWSQAVELAELAERSGLQVVSAPCTILGEAAQTVWKAIRDGRIGKPLLAYAEVDDGLIHLEDLKSWVSASGIPWPYKDEFEVGCTLEHAGYYVTWLVAMFGPAESVTSFASCQIQDKGVDVPLEPPDTPDVSVGCIRFASGVVARLTCSIIGPHDHSMRIFGDKGTLAVKECWNFGSPITFKKRDRWTYGAEKRPNRAMLVGMGPRRFPLIRRPSFRAKLPGLTRIDFCRGVAELADSIREGRPCRLSTRYSLHINEIVLTLQDPRGMGSPRTLTTTGFDPMLPMPWAVD